MRSVNVPLALFIFTATLSAQQSPFATKVIDYRPAPGQFINDPLSGTPSAASSTLGEPSGLVSLGGYGGMITYGFDHPIMNDPANPYGIDLTIFGNAMPNHSEQGIIRIMKDVNENGIPDDTWYEISGSDHCTGKVKRNYSITYFNPAGTQSGNVNWKDIDGKEGYIMTNSFHTQAYYPEHGIFPAIPHDSLTFSGSLLSGRAGKVKNTFISIPSVFGYADNGTVVPGVNYQVPDNPYTLEITEGSGGDPVDISWATDQDGKYIELDRIDFVQVYTGVNMNAGWIGELSTEIAGIADVAENNSITGPVRLILPLDLPEKISAGVSLCLRSLCFESGRPLPGTEIEWSSSDEALARVTVDSVVNFIKPGLVWLSARIRNTSEYLFRKQVSIRTPVEFRIGNIPGFITEGQVFSFEGMMIDDQGERIRGIPPGITVEDERIISVEGLSGDLITLKALKAGETVIHFRFPGYADLDISEIITIHRDYGQFGVSVCLKKDSSTILPRKEYRVGKQDIEAYIDRKEPGYVAGREFISIADVLISVLLGEGFTTSGNKFLFRQDEKGDHKLYLWQLGKDYEFIYGWGGADESGSYSKTWIAIHNGRIIMNGWDTVQVYPGDILSFRHVADIRKPWSHIQLIPLKLTTDPGKDVSFSVRQILVSGSQNSRFTVSGPFMLPDTRVLVNKQHVTVNDTLLLTDYTGEFSIRFGEGGKFLIEVENSSSEAAEVWISYPLGTENETDQPFYIYPNPCSHILRLEGGYHGQLKVAIYSINGKSVMKDCLQGEKLDHYIDITALEPGLYLLEIRGVHFSETRKFMKQ